MHNLLVVLDGRDSGSLYLSVDTLAAGSMCMPQAILSQVNICIGLR